MTAPFHAPTPTASPSWVLRLPRILFALALITIIAVNVFNLGQPLLEEHAFRQTQTAVSARYLQLNGFSLRYETPVAGDPWAIPFEFPIYQQIVATTSSLLGTPLAATGRLINLLFTLLCCIPIHAGLSRLRVDRNATYFALALFLTSPIYLFWAGTFMIEGAALFFTLSFIYYGIGILQGSASNRNILLMTLFLALALLQKITTPLPALGLFCAAMAWKTLSGRQARPAAAVLAKIIAGVALPLLLGALWVKFSDAVKAESILGRLITSAMLTEWNYGTLDQRLSAKLWGKVIYARCIMRNAFHIVGLLFFVAAFWIVRDARVKAVIGASAALFLLPFLMFTNLHIVHNYYQSANVVFLSIAVGVAVASVVAQRMQTRPWLACGVLIAFLASNLFFFSTGYFKLKRMDLTDENRTLAVSLHLKNTTPTDRPVVVFGYDMSSEIAYYAERRTLMLPDGPSFDQPAVLDHLGDYLKRTPSAIVHCPINRPGVDEAIAARIAVHYPDAPTTDIQDCRIYRLP